MDALQLVPDPAGAALPLDHVPVAVLRLVAQGDDDPPPPNEDAGQALQDHEQQQEGVASLPPPGAGAPAVSRYPMMRSRPMVWSRHERPGSCGSHCLMFTVEARACRSIIPDPLGPGPAVPGRPAPTRRTPAPARLPGRHPRPKGPRRTPPSAGRHPRPGGCCGAGRGAVDDRDRRMGHRYLPADRGRAGCPPRRPRPLGRPDRGHHPPYAWSA
jgi:hypothetical protein